MLAARAPVPAAMVRLPPVMSLPPLTVTATAMVPVVVPPAAAISRSIVPARGAIAAAATGEVAIEVVPSQSSTSWKGRGVGRDMGWVPFDGGLFPPPGGERVARAASRVRDL